MKTFRVLLLLLLTVLLLPVRVASADEPTAETVTEIYSAEDMLKIPANPNGSYRLMCDLDLSGIEWPSFAFSGTFDVNRLIVSAAALTMPAAALTILSLSHFALRKP